MTVKIKKLPNDDNAGILSMERLKTIPGFPKEKDFGGKLIAVIECDQDIPCNPCEGICPNSAINIGVPITNLPVLITPKCNGCLRCLAICPGLCIFAVNKDFNEKEALIYIPYEYSPVPEKGTRVKALDRKGDFVCNAKVYRILKSAKKQNSMVIGILAPKEFYNNVRHFEF